jgi:hypothetical protein
LFTHQLGSSTPFSQSFFQIYDSLFLEIMVEAEVISPRTLLTSAPYTRLARGLEVTTNSGGLGINTSTAGHNLLINGSDSLNNVDLGGSGFGEIWLRDGTAGNNLIVDLTATSNSGGRLILDKSGGSAGVDINAGVAGGGSTLNMRNDIGSVTVSFDADGSGNTAAVLPVGSISAIENLEEPGVASDTAYTVFGLALSGSPQNIGSRTITVPTSGYVLVIGTFQAFVSHTTASFSNATFGTSDVSATFPPNQDILVQIDDALPTGSYYYAITVHGLYSVNAGSNTFYFVADEGTGAWTVNDAQFSLAFFPTAYGVVNPTLATGENLSVEEDVSREGGLTASEIAAEQAEAAGFNAVRLERELAEIKTQRADIEARLQKLEQQVGQNQQAAGADE